MVKASQNSNKSSLFGPQTLDMLGTKFSLRFSTLMGKFQTAFGGYLSILMALFSGAAFVVIFSQFFETDAPMVTSSLEFDSQIVKENLFEEEIFLPIAISTEGEGFQSQLFDKYFTVKIKMTIFERDPKTGRSGLRVSRMVDYVRCSDIKDQEIVDKFNKILPNQQFLDKTICPDFRGIKEEFFVKTDPVNYSFNEILLHIYPCSLPDPSQCATKKEVNGVIVIIYRLDKFVVSTDKENPLRENYDRNTIRLDTFNTKYKFMDVKKNMVIDDTSVYGDPYTKLEYATATQASQDSRSGDPTNLHCTKEQVEYGLFNVCADYLMISYRAVSYMMVVRRNYKKLTTIMGEFGGVLKLVTTGVMLFYSIYSSRKMRAFFMKKIFNISEKNSKDFKELMDKADLRKKRQGKPVGGILADQGPINNQPKQPFKNMKDIMKACVQSNLNASEILSKMSFVEVLQQTLFTEDERTLLPLAIISMKEKELLQQSEEAQKKSITKGEESNQQIERIFKKNNKKKGQAQKDLNKTKSQSGSEQKNSNIYKQAYLRMVSARDSRKIGISQNHQDGSTKPISDFILDNVEQFFKEEGIKFLGGENQLVLGKHVQEVAKNQIQERSKNKRPPSIPEEDAFGKKEKKIKLKEADGGIKKSKSKQFQSMVLDPSTNRILNHGADLTPLKINLGRKSSQSSISPIIPLGSPIRRKVRRNKSRLTLKMKTIQFEENDPSPPLEEVNKGGNVRVSKKRLKKRSKSKKEFDFMEIEDEE